ncbi:hypothetical protein Droror1_Dr00026699 [Drosera rotundifolia]
MAESPTNTDTERPCEICGAVGFLELLQVCSKCNVSREHSYCMKMIECEGTETWVCEECKLGNLTLSRKPGPSLVPGGHRDVRWPRPKIKQPPINAKVKYLSPEEVIGLGSVSNRNDSESKPISVSSSTRSMGCMSKRCPETPPSCRQPQTPGRSNTLTCSPSPSMRNQMCKAPKILGQTMGQTNLDHVTKSLKLDAMALSKLVEKAELVINRGSSVSSSWIHDLPVGGSGKKGSAKRMKSLNELADRAPPVALLANNDLPVTSSGKRKTLEAATSKKVEEAATRPRLATSSSKQDEPIGTSGVKVSDNSDLRNMTSEGTEHIDPPLRFDRRLPNHPALHATWRGNFRAIGDTPGKFDGIQAHPASKVHINAYEFSKQMPEVLQFEFCPRGNFWGDVFEGDIPDGLDIGLYFFPRADREIYALLVEHIEIHDYVLRCSMGEVELWITTSKHLHRDSQRINNEHFLWGFFHESSTVEDPLKVTKNLDNSEVVDMDTDMSGGENIVRNPCFSSSDCGQPMLNGHQSLDLVSCEAEDMEVDMLGGQSVGKVDVVVPMPSEQKNMTVQPVSQVKPKPMKGNQLFLPRVISAGLLSKPVEKVNAHAPPPSKQENHSCQLLSKVKTECIKEGMLPPTSTSAAATNLASTDVLCKMISSSPFGCIEQAPPGFTEADKVKNKERMSIPPVPSNLAPTAMLFTPTSSSSLACVGSAPPGFTEADKVKNKERMSIPPVPSNLAPAAMLVTPTSSSSLACVGSAPPDFTEADKVKNKDRMSIPSVPSNLTPTAMLCKPTSSSPLACVRSAPLGFTEADKVKNKDRTNSPVVPSNLTSTARLCTATRSYPSACIESAPLGFTLTDRVKNKDRSNNAAASPQ